MRQILVQRARARHAEKRGGPNADRITLDESVMAEHTPDAPGGVDVLALDAALERLAALNPTRPRSSASGISAGSPSKKRLTHSTFLPRR